MIGAWSLHTSDCLSVFECLCVSLCECVSECFWVCVSVSVCVCVCDSVCECVSVSDCDCLCLCMSVCIYVCLYEDRGITSGQNVCVCTLSIQCPLYPVHATYFIRKLVMILHAFFLYKKVRISFVNKHFLNKWTKIIPSVNDRTLQNVNIAILTWREPQLKTSFRTLDASL